MTWISLLGLLVFTSSALGLPAYGSSFAAAPMVIQAPKLLPVVSFPTSTYGQQPIITQRVLPIMHKDVSNLHVKHAGGYGSPLINSMALVRTIPTQTYGVPSIVPQFDQSVLPLAPPTLPPTPADILCQGKPAETVIPLGDGSRFVVCIDFGKGVEQDCPRGLFYHVEKRRCERRTGPVDPCAIQPCLNGGQCFATDSSYQCQCPPGFDGITCELDARVCQTQQPCGQAPDTRCQSFRLGAALQYICIFQSGFAYGLNTQQVIPSPCSNVDGAQALAVTNAGFIMCDADRMSVESCPGGTIWDDIEKACTWPDKQTVEIIDDQTRMLSKSFVTNQYSVPQQIERSNMIISKQVEFPRPTLSYGAQLERPKPVISLPAQLDLPKQVSSYGAELDLPRPVAPIPISFDLPKQVSSYGAQLDLPKQVSSYGAQLDLPKPIVPIRVQMDLPKPVSSYGAQFDLPKVSSYGAQLDLPKPIVPIRVQMDLPKPVSSYGAQLDIPKPVSSYGAQLDLPKQVSTYGAQLDIPKPVAPIHIQLDLPKQVSTYGAQMDRPKPVASYGAQVLLPQQPEQIKVITQQRDEFVPSSKSYGY